MATLPPLTEQPGTFADLLALARSRVRQAWEIDPVDGCEDAPWLECETRGESAVFLALLGLWPATLITLFFTRGPVLWVLAGVTVILSLWLRGRCKVNAKNVRAIRRDGHVVAAAIVQANKELFEPGESARPALLLYSEDETLGSDPEGLAALAGRMWDELRDAETSGMSPDLKALAERITDERPRWKPGAVPEDYAGAPDTWVTDVTVIRDLLPHGHIDRRLWFLSVLETDPPVGARLLPTRFWWREDFDDLMRPDEDGDEE